MKIHLLGDSLVQTIRPGHGNFYCTWGQQLKHFFDDKTEIVNYALGGRSCRSYLNEGRFYDNGLFTKEMAPQGVGPAFTQISKGDYVFIQFMWNDNDLKTCSYRVNKRVWLGCPDENGIFPTVVPTEDMLSSTDGWDNGYKDSLAAEGYSDEEIKTIMEITEGLIDMTGGKYYSFDCGATYKGYYKFYIDKIREKCAIPVVVISGVHCSFKDEKIAPMWEHCEIMYKRTPFPYVDALRQLVEEENVLCIDMFAVEKELYEELGDEKATYLHNISIEADDVQNIDEAELNLSSMADAYNWIVDYNERRRTNNYKGIDRSHRNYFGGFMQAAEIADSMYQQGILCEHIKTVPSYFEGIPEVLKGDKDLFESKLKHIKIFSEDK